MWQSEWLVKKKPFVIVNWTGSATGMNCNRVYNGYESDIMDKHFSILQIN